MSPSERTYNET